MDHSGISQDREDLERYRKGLPPLQRKEYVVKELLPIHKVDKESLKILQQAICRKKTTKK